MRKRLMGWLCPASIYLAACTATQGGNDGTVAGPAATSDVPEDILHYTGPAPTKLDDVKGIWLLRTDGHPVWTPELVLRVKITDVKMIIACEYKGKVYSQTVGAQTQWAANRDLTLNLLSTYKLTLDDGALQLGGTSGSYETDSYAENGGKTATIRWDSHDAPVVFCEQVKTERGGPECLSRDGITRWTKIADG